MNLKILSTILLSLSNFSNAFQSTALTFSRISTNSIVKPRKTSFVILNQAKNKGFQKKTKKSNKKPNPQPQPETVQQQEETTTQQITSTNEGQRALEQLRNEKRTKQEEEIRKMRDIKSVDEFIRDDPNAAVIPEKVAMRMGNRMLPFVGIPLFGVMATFVGFWYMATVKNVVFETNVVAFSTIFVLVIGLSVSLT